MTLPRETMLELMAYADGELEGEARARVEALVLRDAEARGVVEALGALGDEVHEAVLGRPVATDVVDAVMARLEPNVVLLQPRRARAAVGLAVAGALALAAAYALVVRTAVETIATPSAPTSASGATGPAALASAADPDGNGQGVAVEQLESPERSVSVIYLPAAAAAANANASTVVVWIADDVASSTGDQ